MHAGIVMRHNPGEQSLRRHPGCRKVVLCSGRDEWRFLTRSETSGYRFLRRMLDLRRRMRHVGCCTQCGIGADIGKGRFDARVLVDAERSVEAAVVVRCFGLRQRFVGSITARPGLCDLLGASEAGEEACSSAKGSGRDSVAAETMGRDGSSSS